MRYLRTRSPLVAALAWIAVFVTEGTVHAAKTDKIVLANGDVVTGEVKELTQGLLRYSTDSMSTVWVEWVDVVGVTSAQHFQVEKKNGEFVFGALLPNEAAHTTRIGIGAFVVDLPNDVIVRISPIKEGFWKTLDGSLSLGFQFTKANDVLQWTISGSAQRRRRRYMTRLSARFSLTTTGDSSSTVNNQLAYAYNRLLGGGWGAGGSLTFQQNDELGIALRSLIAGIGTRSLWQSIRQRSTISGGLAFNRENTTAGELNNSIEGVVSFNWTVFKHKSPKTDLAFVANLYPSVTQSGRYRANSNIELRQEMVKDFFWDLTGWYNFDNQPPGGTGVTEDYGITTSFGWTF